MLDLIWRPEAERQFLGMLEYIAARNAAASLRIKRLVDDRIALALAVPGIGRPGRVAGTRELVVHPNYIVIYTHDGTTLRVIRVLHSRQRYP
jgi:toxin ParE1/3/4